MTNQISFKDININNPTWHPIITEVITSANQEIALRFPDISFELIPLGSGRGPGAKVRAILDAELDCLRSISDIDLGIIIHEPWPKKLTFGHFTGVVSRICEQESRLQCGKYLCPDFNPINCFLLVQKQSLRNLIYLAHADVGEGGDLTEAAFRILHNLSLPLLSKDPFAREQFLLLLQEIVVEEPWLWNHHLEATWLNIYKDILLPKLEKQFRSDLKLRAQFEAEVRLE